MDKELQSVGAQTEKAVSNALESMSKNIKFKRVVSFAINVLNEVVCDAGTSSRLNANYLASQKGYKQLINVLKTHPDHPDFSKVVCDILNHLLDLRNDIQLPDKMVECGAAEALRLLVVTPPTKDLQTSKLILEIFNHLFTTKGVLHKEVVRQSKDVLNMFLTTENSDLAARAIDCLAGVCSQGGQGLESETVRKVLSLVDKHRTALSVALAGSRYIKTAYSTAKGDEIRSSTVAIREMIRCLGDLNSHKEIFTNMDIATDKVGDSAELYAVIEEIWAGQSQSDNFWIMAHLIDNTNADISAKSEQIIRIMASLEEQGKLQGLYGECSFFLSEFFKSKPELCEQVMQERSELIKRFMEQVDTQTGPKRFLGLQVLEDNVKAHGEYMRQNNIIERLKIWIGECATPEDMETILRFMSKICVNNENLRNDIIAAKLDDIAIQKVNENFKDSVPVYEANINFLNFAIRSPTEIDQFCTEGKATLMITSGYNLQQEIQNFDEMLDFIGKLFDVPNPNPKLNDSLPELVQLYSTRFERRVVDWADSWYNDRENSEKWVQNFRPEVPQSLSTQKERKALSAILKDHSIEKTEEVLRAMAIGEKGPEAIKKLSLEVAVLNCLILKEDPTKMSSMLSKKGIDEAVDALASNLDYLRKKNLDETRITSRFIALWCACLPLFRNPTFVKSVTTKKSEFAYAIYTKFITETTKRDPLVTFFVMIAYGMLVIPKSMIPELPKSKAEEGDEKDAHEMQEIDWSPLTIILSADGCDASTPISEAILSLNKKSNENARPLFYGYIALREVFRFGCEDTMRLLTSSFLSEIIANIDEGTIPPHEGTSISFMLDGWCESTEQAIMKLNSLGAYDKFLRYMNSHKNNLILRQVVSSLLQKLAAGSDNNQMKLDLDSLIKKCKEYEKTVEAGKSDEMRDEALGAYNKIYGIMQVKKYISFCISKGLPGVSLGTIANELKRSPSELLDSGNIVTFQDLSLLMLLTANQLYDIAKAAPEDNLPACQALKNAAINWGSDKSTLEAVVDLFNKIIRKSNMVEGLSDDERREIASILVAFKQQNSDDANLVEKIEKAVLILSPKEEVKAKEPEREIEDILKSVKPVKLVRRIVKAVQEQIVEEPKAGVNEVLEQNIEQTEEEVNKEIQDNFVTENVMAETKEEHLQPVEDLTLEEDAADEIIEQINEQHQVDPESAQEEKELNLRIEEDQTTALFAASSKIECPTDSSKDAMLQKIHKLALALDVDELKLAIFFAKLYCKLGAIPELKANIRESNIPKIILANIERFNDSQELISWTCVALSILTKDDKEIMKTLRNLGVGTVLKPSLQYLMDYVGIYHFGQLVRRIDDSEETKVILTNLGYPNILAVLAITAVEKQQPKAVSSCLKAIYGLSCSKKTVPVMTGKTPIIQNLINIAVEYSSDKDICCVMMDILGNFVKNGGEKIRDMAIDHGMAEYYSEIFLEWSKDRDVLRHFYTSASNMGNCSHFWITLDSLELAQFTFLYSKTALLEEVKAALICLFFMCKINDIAEKTVFRDFYTSLDDCVQNYDDNTILSYVLVIENILSATIRRQHHLINGGFHRTVATYYDKVIAADKEKLLIIWVSILCKLTNSEQSCSYFLVNIFEKLFILAQAYFENPVIFERLYNLLTNILIGTCGPLEPTEKLLALSFKKLGLRFSDNFFTIYVNFLENLIGLSNPQLEGLFASLKEQIIHTMSEVPLLLKHISKNMQEKFEIRFPRQTTSEAVEPFFKLPFDQAQLYFLTKGTPCKRYRRGGIIEQGTLFLDRHIRRLVFKRLNSMSLFSRDILELDQIIKIVKGHDARSAFAEAIKKYNLKLGQEVCMMMLASKVSQGETGLYIQFATTETRRKWKEALRIIIKNVTKVK